MVPKGWIVSRAISGPEAVTYLSNEHNIDKALAQYGGKSNHFVKKVFFPRGPTVGQTPL
jgi:hypothetical protein